MRECLNKCRYNFEHNPMNIEELREYCLSKKGVAESFPFDESTLVFKLMDKMFALTSLDEDFRINLKCDPEEAIRLRQEHSCVIPGYHMSKKHWNTIIVDGSVPVNQFKKWIDDSYNLVFASLSRKKKEELEQL
jgi:predicted DNA-binding protein (MmcQ/YjbR family)